MEVLIILFGGIFVGGGYWLIRHTPNYETVKTTNGKTIRFLNYTEAKKHKRKKILGTLTLVIGIASVVLAILYELMLKN